MPSFLAAILSCCLLLWGAWRLGRVLQVAPLLLAVAIFLVFSTQMYYATVAHIANDWLAVPLSAIFLGQAVAFQQRPTGRGALLLAASYGAGLLTKAYFLAFGPFLVWLLVSSWRKHKRSMPIVVCVVSLALIAGPWYVRNLTLYGNLTGMQEATIGGLGPLDVIRSLFTYPWLSALPRLAHASLWTGNNSFTTFSSDTIGVQLFLLLCATGLCIIDATRRGFSSDRATVLVAILSFAAGLAYAAVQSYLYTEGLAVLLSPWYTQPLLAPVLLLLLSGRWTFGFTGRVVQGMMLLLWTYVSTATFVVKLIPWYAGYGDSQVRLPHLLRWYSQDFDQAWHILKTLCLVDPLWLLILSASACFVGWLVCVALLIAMHRIVPEAPFRP